MFHINRNETRLFIVILCLGFFLCTPHVMYAQPINFTLDFETGDLRGWTKTGNSFDYQPTLGDNPTARRRGQPSNHQGRYWIGSYEKYQGHPNQRLGNIQGDRPQGILTSSRFTIPQGTLSFLVGGGSNFETRVELLVQDPIEGSIMVLHASGQNTETMRRVTWELTPFARKTGKIRIVDASSEPWGHINVDDFRFSSAPHFETPTTPVLPPDQKVEVPDLVRRNVSEAESILNRFKLRLGEITKKPSNQKPGTILRQSPVAHSKVESGTSIHIWVAERELVEVPSLINHHVNEAERILRDFGLKSGEITKRASEYEDGIILQQEPSAGTRVPVGSPVNLWISSKREKPVAKINPAHLRITQGEKAVFKSQSTPKGVTRERWRGPRGQAGEGRNFEVRTDQLNPGQYEIVLLIMDRQEQSDKALATLEVTPIDYRVFLEAEPTRTETGKTVIFRAKFEPRAVKIEYRFIFGDGKVRDWSNEAIAEHNYPEPGNYHAYVVARIDHNIISESSPVMLTIKPSSKTPWILISVGSLSILVGGYYLFSRIKKPEKAIEEVTPEIQIKSHKDIGTQQIESDTPVQLDLEMRLRPVLDQGRQEVESKGSLITDERREHE